MKTRTLTVVSALIAVLFVAHRDERPVAGNRANAQHGEKPVAGNRASAQRPSYKTQVLDYTQYGFNADVPLGGTIAYGSIINHSLILNPIVPNDHGESQFWRLELELRQLPAAFTGIPNCPDYQFGTVAPGGGGHYTRIPGSDLPPGNYRWRYRLVDAQGVVVASGEAGNDPDFTILPPEATIYATKPLAKTASAGEFTVSLSGPARAGTAVTYTVSGTAKAVPLLGFVTIAAGESSATISVTPDPKKTTDKATVIVDLSPGNGYTIGMPSRATVTISNPPAASIVATTTAQAHPPTKGIFTVSLSAPAPNGGMEVGYTVSGSAKLDVDYAALPASVTISDGETSATIEVTPSQAPIDGSRVLITLNNGLGYTVGIPSSATVTISNPKPPDQEPPGQGNPGNGQSPVATPQAVQVNEFGEVVITLTGTPPANISSLAISSLPSAYLDTSKINQRVVKYTQKTLPTAGTDSFTFTVSDGINTSAPATVSISLKSFKFGSVVPGAPAVPFCLQALPLADGFNDTEAGIRFRSDPNSTSNQFRVHYSYWDGVYGDSTPVHSAPLDKTGQFRVLPVPSDFNQIMAITAKGDAGESEYSLQKFIPYLSPSAQAKHKLAAEIAVNPRFDSLPFNYHAEIMGDALLPAFLNGEISLSSYLQARSLAAFSDIIPIYQTDPVYHFDEGKLIASAINVTTLMQEASSPKNETSLSIILPFAQAHHAVSDFYSHTDYVEKWVKSHPGQLPQSFDIANLDDFNALSTCTSGYYEGLTGIPKHYFKTFPVPQTHDPKGFVTIYNDLDTKATIAKGFNVGFVPWHGIMNKDTPSTPEGKVVLNGSSNNLHEIALQFAKLHTKKLFDDLSDNAKAILGGGGALPSGFKKLSQSQQSALVAGVQSTEGQTNSGQANTVSLGIFATGKSSVLGMFSLRIDGNGSISVLLSGSSKFNKKTSTSSVKMTGKDFFIPEPVQTTNRTKATPSSTSLAGKITVAGGVDANGVFTGTATIQVKAAKGGKPQVITVNCQTTIAKQ